MSYRLRSVSAAVRQCLKAFGAQVKESREIASATSLTYCTFYSLTGK